MNKFKLVLIICLFCLLGYLSGFQKTSIARAEVSSTCSGLNCDSSGACVKDETFPFLITLPTGSVINQVWVKASTSCFSFTANDNDGCYSVSGIGTQTVKVEKIGSGSNCNDISNIEAIVTPTAVTVFSFSARYHPDLILVRWSSAFEINTYGYNVWRSTSQNGPFSRLNSTTIPVVVGSVGTDYSFKDRFFTLGTRYFYKLEELNGGGSSWYENLATVRCLP